MNGQIFISYRREESRWSARSLYDRLCAHFDRKQIFMDIDAIALGDDFVKAIEKTVGQCEVLIAVIGARWLTSKDEQDGRRLDNPEDFVRREIATALKREIRVIPVLVDGASMPRSTELPDDLKPLIRRNALQVTDTGFDDDCRRLVAAIEQILEEAKTGRREREERERLQAKRRATEAKESLSPPAGPVAPSKTPHKRRVGPMPGIMALLALGIGLTVFAVIYFGAQRPESKPTAPAAEAPSPKPIPSVVVATPSAEEPSTPASSRTEERVITVWKVGSPHSGETPDTTVPLDLERSAEQIDHRLKIEAFPAKDFAEAFFEAFKKNQEPDILAIDNYGIINGIRTSLGTFTGIESNDTVRQKLVGVTQSLKELEGPQGGWEFLLSTSKNYDAAKLLALRAPECDAGWKLTPLPPDLKGIAGRIGWAYLRGDATTLKTLDDADRIYTAVPDQNQLQVSETKECGYWGNDHLAFVPMVFTFELPKTLGRIAMLLVFRKQDSRWRLLAASTDPVSTKGFVEEIPGLVSLLRKAWTPDRKPIPAELLTPADGQFPQPAAGQRFGDFSWHPSTSTNVVAEIVEFAYTAAISGRPSNNDARLFIRLRSGNSPLKDQISDGQLWTTRGLWRWRVWSISDAGDVSISESRSFSH
jgi:hypothetical protein